MESNRLSPHEKKATLLVSLTFMLGRFISLLIRLLKVFYRSNGTLFSERSRSLSFIFNV